MIQASPRTRKARELFAPLGPTYERYARVLSLGQDPRWRRFLVSRVDVGSDGRVLDVATGSGNAALAAARCGCEVVGIDYVPALLARGRRRAEAEGLELELLEADAEALPFPDGAFDLVVAYNSLMDVADMPSAVGEAARVLAPGGRLCVCVTHPMADAGTWLDDTHFAVIEPYLERREMHVPIERDGLAFTFEGPAYPLQDYIAALEGAGLAIEALREPADPEGGRWARVPMFLMWRAVKT
jgi:ubiquinone/menaquinone biosynthesis C-methylase UbiE